jgi:hypothetical protein
VFKTAFAVLIQGFYVPLSYVRRNSRSINYISTRASPGAKTSSMDHNSRSGGPCDGGNDCSGLHLQH